MKHISTLEKLAREIGYFLEPIGTLIDPPEYAVEVYNDESGAAEIPVFDQIKQIEAFLTAAGVDLGNAGNQINFFSDIISTLASIWKELEPELKKPEPNYRTLYDGILRFYNELEKLKTFEFQRGTDPSGALFEKISNYLVLLYLQRRQPAIHSFSQLTGIVEISDEGNESFSPSKLMEIFSDPIELVKTTMGWGTDQFDHQLVIQYLYNLFYHLGIDAELQLAFSHSFGGMEPPSTGLTGLLEDVSALDNLPEPEPLAYGESLKIPIGSNTANNLQLEIGFMVFGLPPIDEKKPGLALSIYGNIQQDVEKNLDNDWVISIAGSLSGEANTAFLVRPDSMGIETSGSHTVQTDYSFDLKVKKENLSTEPIRLFTIPGIGYCEYKGIAVKGKLEGDNSKHSQELMISFTDVTLSLNPDDADSFLSKLLPSEGITTTFDIGMGIRSDGGFFFENSTDLATSLSVLSPQSTNFINLLALHLSLSFLQNKISLKLGVAGNASLGVLQISIDDIGISLTAGKDLLEKASGINDLSLPFFPSSNLDLAFDFSPPKGIGLAITTGVIQGGGFLGLRPEKGEYFGIMELTFSEVVSLKAVGIINTKMPDGSDGFSMLVIITAGFGSGIQLGFGFTLLAVGGLLGLNRTMKLEALATGVRTGAVNGIMFPTNIIENAPRIISDLQTFFPVQQDRFLIGPMAKLAWGTPALITISLGIIIEIPGNIAILGVLKIVLPTEEASLIKLQVNFIGVIEFDKERLWFFASMYDSRVLFYTLEGEMGLLVGWGAKANFVSSVGGFHPAFNPPALPFPSPVRISLSILNESWGKIRVMGYFAVTSNTAQFGAKAELYFKFSEFKIEGHIGFDALFQFSPFYMVIQLSASLSVKVFGAGLFSVRVKMSLEGPAPWNARGTGSISLLLFDIDVDFDFTWGEEKDTTLPPISIMPLLVTEFEKKENWKALVPKNNKLLVSLREIDSVAELVLHPVGRLQVSQRKIPLSLTLEKMGSQKPEDANFFSLESQDSELSKIKTLEEDFAIAQFKDLKDAEKLSSPAYQPIEGGMELSVSGEQLKTGQSVKRHIRYELITVDTNYKRGIPILFKIIKSLFGVFLRGNTVSRAEVSFQTKKNLQPFDSQIKITDTGFSVAKISNNSILDAKAHFSSQAQAKEYMQAQLLVNPELDGELHVLPNNEINPAA